MAEVAFSVAPTVKRANCSGFGRYIQRNAQPSWATPPRRGYLRRRHVATGPTKWWLTRNRSRMKV